MSVLRLAGCSQFQGYLFSQPVGAEQIGGLLIRPDMAIAV